MSHLNPPNDATRQKLISQLNITQNHPFFRGSKSLKQYLGEIFHDLARQKECKIIEGHLMPDHVHILISIPPKYAVSQVVGFLKGKSAIQLARSFLGRKRNYMGHHFWARGYLVSTVGKDEETVRKYIQRQEKEDQRIDQLSLLPEE